MSDEMHTCPACGIEYADDVLMKLRAENAALKALIDAYKVRPRGKSVFPEIAQLAQENAALRTGKEEARIAFMAEVEFLRSERKTLTAERDALKAENAALRAGAEMYHWLRDGFSYQVTNPALRLVVILEESADAYESVAGEKLDRIIREAMMSEGVERTTPKYAVMQTSKPLLEEIAAAVAKEQR